MHYCQLARNDINGHALFYVNNKSAAATVSATPTPSFFFFLNTSLIQSIQINHKTKLQQYTNLRSFLFLSLKILSYVFWLTFLPYC